MKKTTLIFLALCSVSSFANEAKLLPNGAKALQLLSEASIVEVKSVAPRCPRGAVCEVASIAKIAFTLSGCMDTLGPVTVNYQRNQTGTLTLQVTAVEIQNEASERVRCFAPNVKTIDVHVGMGFVSKESLKLEMNTQDYSRSKQK